MVIVKGFQISIRKNIYVMYQKWFIPLEESGCFLDASSCIEQLFPFVTDVDGQPEMLVGLQSGGC